MMEHVILHSVNVNIKIKTWRMVCMFSIFLIWNKSDVAETQIQVMKLLLPQSGRSEEAKTTSRTVTTLKRRIPSSSSGSTSV